MFSDRMYVLLPTLLLYAVREGGCETYTAKYDGVDLDEVLSNERLLTGYVHCLLGVGACSPDGKELKIKCSNLIKSMKCHNVVENLPDAIQNECSKCTDRQRDGADRVMHFLIDNRPEDWDQLEQKYNSDGSYKLKYLSSKEKSVKSESSETQSYEDDDDDEDETNKDNYSKKQTDS